MTHNQNPLFGPVEGKKKKLHQNQQQNKSSKRSMNYISIHPSTTLTLVSVHLRFLQRGVCYVGLCCGDITRTRCCCCCGMSEAAAAAAAATSGYKYLLSGKKWEALNNSVGLETTSGDDCTSILKTGRHLVSTRLSVEVSASRNSDMSGWGEGGAFKINTQIQFWKIL